MPELPKPKTGAGLWARLPLKRPVVRLADLAHPASLKTWQVTAGAAALGLVVVAGALTAAGPWDSDGQRTAEARRATAGAPGGGADHGRPRPGGTPQPARSAPEVLSALGSTAPDTHRATGTEPTEASLRRLLGPQLADASLGEHRAAAVVDIATGHRLYGEDAGRSLTPASTTKLATAVAALSAVGPGHRLTTRTVLQPGGHGTPRVVLVGGGDPTLTARPDAAGNASLRKLAADTARRLAADKHDEISLGYDTGLYTGTEQHRIGPNENLAPVTALLHDEGRLDDSTGGPAPRSTDPAADTARTFAALLADHGVRTRGRPAPASAGGKPEQLAAVHSPPLSALVERMLTQSDNDIAEHLARHTALAAGKPADFAGGGAAVHARLAKLQLPLNGAHFADGSGLDRADRLTAGLLTSLLATAGDKDHPELRSVLTGLPVAGFTGTLQNRYGGAEEAPATGLVRAKTGTLTGVNTLAGTVVDADGRLLAFAFMTAGSTTPGPTQTSLDRLATTLTTCGCG
ncbi:D-alanyl-D-alanine carboxypeptidase/D-alanyl-D-alanine-endopeptidase [Streptomyces sp. NPDC058045]|uniref:D-alanyl-D-alanine carboxypeptidase/D-alanyl-D-alanine endopeptidase n=1 Tax=Streptomyces sp. NPDC058045 TaxID=3346311 RepID=UPI0036EC7C5E